MKLLDLFSGIGGFSLAAHWLGWETVAFVEKDEFCQKVLAKNFNGVPIYGDITEFDGRGISADIVCGGFPCQPFSHAGKRAGTADERHLFPQMLRVISEVKPKFVVAENVRGLLSIESGRVFADVIASLESEGYEVVTFCIPASAVNAPHRRDRIWIIAHADRESEPIRAGNAKKKSERLWNAFNADRIGERAGFGKVQSADGEIPERDFDAEFGDTDSDTASDSIGEQNDGIGRDCQCGRLGTGRSAPRQQHGRWEQHWLEAAGEFCRVSDGLPAELDAADRQVIYNAVGYFGWEAVSRAIGVDCSKVENLLHRTERLKALGNSIVPTIAYEIFKAIEAAEKL